MKSWFYLFFIPLFLFVLNPQAQGKSELYCHTILRTQDRPWNYALEMPYTKTNQLHLNPSSSQRVALLREINRFSFVEPDAFIAEQIQSRYEPWAQAIESKLNEQGVAFDKFYVTESLPYGIHLSWVSFLIRDSGTHWLNRMSRKMKVKIKTDLRIDPLWLAFKKAAGFYSHKQGAIFVRDTVLQFDKPSNIFRHEIIHALKAAERSELIPWRDEPIHIRFQTTRSFDNSNWHDPYAKEMGFEEIITFSHNLQTLARAVLKTPSQLIEALHPDSSTSYDLAYYQNKLWNIASYAEVSSRVGIEMMNQGSITTLPWGRGQALILRSPDLDFTLHIFIPKKEGKRLYAYAQAQLLAAQALAQFTKNYLSTPHDSISEQLNHLSQLRKAQQNFLLSLKRQ